MEKIAIIGIGGLFPGGLNPKELYQLLIENKRKVREVKQEDLSKYVGFYTETHDILKRKEFTVEGGIVDNFSLNTDGLLLDKDFLLSQDINTQWLVKVMRDALIDSGYYKNLKVLDKAGFILGILGFGTDNNDVFSSVYNEILNPILRTALNNNDIKMDLSHDFPGFKRQRIFTTSFPGIISGMAFGMHGPTYSFDAACSSSLYSLKLASYYLQTKKTDIMLAGAICKPALMGTINGFLNLKAANPEENSIPFDIESGGLTFGEGAGIFVLKRYSDAIKHNDKIYAVIDGIGWSNDGGAQYILAPDIGGQKLAYDNLYLKQGISKEIDYIECHATGTPRGDRVELDSLESYFKNNKNIPLYGANKYNVGHLLTASGMVSMIKVIYSMKNGIIPATIGVNKPNSSKDGVFSKDNLVLKNTEWKQNGEVKRAAINAFGFGGTNGHALFSEHINNKKYEYIPFENSEKWKSLAIVGMGAHFGSSSDLNKLNETIYKSVNNYIKLPEYRWRGYENNKRLNELFGLDSDIRSVGGFIEDFEFDFLNFKIPPNVSEDIFIKDLFALKIAEEAIKDANIDNKQNNKVAVLIAGEFNASGVMYAKSEFLPKELDDCFSKFGINLSTEQRRKIEKYCFDTLSTLSRFEDTTTNVSNIMPNRISSVWKFNGPSFKFFSQESNVFKMIELAEILLSLEDLDYVVVGTVDFCGDFERVILDSKEGRLNHYIGEGGAAIVLKSNDKAEKDGDKIYATIDGISVVDGKVYEHGSDFIPKTQYIQECSKNALRIAGVSPDDVQYMELSSYLNRENTQIEIDSLQDVYTPSSRKSDIYAGSIKQNLGDTGFSNSIAGIIKSALLLYYKYIPGHQKERNFIYNLTEKSSFLFNSKPLYWLPNPENKKKRVCAINGLGSDMCYSHLIMSESTKTAPTKQIKSNSKKYNLYLISGESAEELLNDLNDLRVKVEQNSNIVSLSSILYKKFLDKKQASKNKLLTLSIVAASGKELSVEIKTAFDGVKNSFETGKEWSSRSGSYFTPKPFGKDVEIAYVYPMSGVNNKEKIREMFQCFPAFVNEMENIFDVKSDSFDSLKRILIADTQFAPYLDFQSSILTTNILNKVLKVKPSKAFGCSLGEMCMTVALDMYDIKKDESRLNLYLNFIDPVMDFVRDKSKIDSFFGEKDIEWKVFYLNGNVDYILEKLKNETKVFPFIIGSPQDIIIAGEKKSILDFLQEVKCFSFPIFDEIFAHTPIFSLSKGSIKEIINKAVFSFKDEDFPFMIYSTHDSAPLKVNESDFLNNTINYLGNSVDFRNVVKRVYDDGAKIFIEQGTSDFCTKWINETLSGKDFTSISMNYSGMEFEKNILLVAAQLLSHQVDIDLSAFFDVEVIKSEKTFMKRLLNGKKPVIPSIVVDTSNTYLNEEKHKEIINETNKNESDSFSVKNDDIIKVEDTVETYKSEREVKEITGESLISEYKKVFFQNAEIHKKYLELQNSSMKLLGDFYKSLEPVSVSSELINSYNKKQPVQVDIEKVSKKREDIVFDYDQLVEMTDGKMSTVLGEEYAPLDNRLIRNRMPLPPFMFVNRVVKLNARRGEYIPSSIETEFDIPEDPWFGYKGTITSMTLHESSHSIIFMLSYIGIDLDSEEDIRFRAADSLAEFYKKLPKGGSTVKGVMKIKSFTKQKNRMIVPYEYLCYDQEGELIFKIDGVGGVFPKKDIDNTKGATLPKWLKNVKKKTNTYKPVFKKLKKSFDSEEVDFFYTGNFGKLFGDEYLKAMDNNIDYFVPEKMRMFDNVVSIDPDGGEYGLGKIVTQKHIDSDHWAFKLHFKNDPVLPGVVIMEGASQSLVFYVFYMDLNLKLQNKKIEVNPGRDIVAKTIFRGEVKCKPGTLEYHLIIKDINEETLTIIADVHIYYDEKLIVISESISLTIDEKEGKNEF